jgi:2-polyprenyl-3-methyl-5-hydroxy-6-metoxy-1,4-benzoquinol methylase
MSSGVSANQTLSMMPQIVVDDSQIRTAPCPRCILCGSNGNLVYTGVPDRLFEARGLWNFKICSEPSCRLIWLDPMPVKEDLPKAYANYYTHKMAAGAHGAGLLKRISRLAERGYWAEKYHYPMADSWWVKASGKLLYLFPIRRRGADGEVRFLPAVPNGRLLDVGCGSGDWLLLMRELGWQVEGIDFDERALEVARKSGLQVRCGSLEEQSFPSASFDAVILNHVIEHLPDPIGNLLECARLLRPGGKLVVCTPNGSSLGHRLFKGKWRGLEPPRHLHVFSEQSMHRLLERAGFREISFRPLIAKSVIYESILLSWGRTGFGSVARRSLLAEGFARLFNILELGLLRWKPSVADCLAVVAVR